MEGSAAHVLLLSCFYATQHLTSTLNSGFCPISHVVKKANVPPPSSPGFLGLVSLLYANILIIDRLPRLEA